MAIFATTGREKTGLKKKLEKEEKREKATVLRALSRERRKRGGN